MYLVVMRFQKRMLLHRPHYYASFPLLTSLFERRCTTIGTGSSCNNNGSKRIITGRTLRILQTSIIVSCIILIFLFVDYYYDSEYNDDNNNEPYDTTKGLTITYQRSTTITSLDSQVNNNNNNKEKDEDKDDIIVGATITYLGLDGIHTLMYNYFHNAFLCEIDSIREKTNNPTLPITINITFSSIELYNDSGYGTGNMIELFYGLRIPAFMYEMVEVYIIDTDDISITKRTLILPWLTGYIPPQYLSDNDNSNNNNNKEEKKICTTIQPIANMYSDIQYDLRRMAIALVGTIPDQISSQRFVQTQLHWNIPIRLPIVVTTDSKHTNLKLEPPLIHMKHTIPTPQITDTPIYPNLFYNTSSSSHTLDDIIIHFRCGDVMDSTHPGFAFMKFHSYIQHIITNFDEYNNNNNNNNNMEKKISIGIVTQPYDTNDDTTTTTKSTATTTKSKSKTNFLQQIRKYDNNNIAKNRCRIVVQSFVQYIHKKLPNIVQNVHVYNNETITISYARMIMTPQQVIVGISSFSSFPAVASFASYGSYIRIPTTYQGPNYWLIDPQPIHKLGATNVILYNEPNIISASKMKLLWETKGKAGVLQWFWE